MIERIYVLIWKWIDKIAYIVLNFFCRICHKNLSKEMQAIFMQFVKFGIVGISNTFIFYLIYIIALVIFQSSSFEGKYNYLIAQVIAFASSVLWAFYWNNKIVFVEDQKKRRKRWKTFLKTFVVYAFTGLFLNSVLLILWVQILNISEYLAPVLNLLFSVPLNFLINKFWAFG